ncbi:MAG: thioredoxin domain-containing protein, partial [Candidatus Sericytochromatia bacterium]
MPNHLQGEQSPYLLQHLENPVDWYPWGPEAFDKARREDKPIFLSIGYSTCHWCHVMAHESFEDEDVARLLNESFVCIKLDREERPDIDQIYMSVCQMMTGQGGWPLTVVMTPAQQPFFAGTYFPKYSQYGRMGLMDLARRLSELWTSQRAKVLESATGITAMLQEVEQPAGSQAPSLALQDQAYAQLAQSFDPEYGGFREAPKFPTPHNLLFLLRYARRKEQPQARMMVEKTLTQMRRGGIWDHVGFGFHRYSTDPYWLLPHFEKMLYDQALLLLAYAEAWQAGGDPLLRQTATEIVTYVLRDLRAPEAGFYCAEDADSEGEEGKFYVWAEAELADLVDPDALAFLRAGFGVRPQGNFHDEAGHATPGTNILHLPADPAEAARAQGLSAAEFGARWEALRQQLFAVREKRIRPHLDDKILTDWNGLMIAALARAGFILDQPEWIQAAAAAARFVRQRLWTEQGLLHRYRQGEAGIAAHLDDYAMLIWGLLELYQASFAPEWLSSALELAGQALERFGSATGGFYFTARDGEALIVRKQEYYDGAQPSGNAVMLHNLLRLYHLTGDARWRQAGEGLSTAFYAQAGKHPLAYLHFVSGLEW